jgi:UDP-N-acetylmuramoyl-L-alanyl-D-glutamate--2,6-diaminopimelate ligase
MTFRKILNEVKEMGIDNFAFEASSHGIFQGRLGDVKVKTAGFTSFSQDHLDYHNNMESYLKAKLQLFVNNLEEAQALI